MKEGAGADLNLIMNVRDSTSMFLICNNSVTDFETAKDMFSRGADMVSVARGVLQNPKIIPSNVIADIDASYGLRTCGIRRRQIPEETQR